MGHFVLNKPGHELNNLFLANIMEEPGLVELSAVEDGSSQDGSISMDVKQLPHLAIPIDDSCWAPAAINA